MRTPGSIPDGWRQVRIEDVASVNPKRPTLHVEDDALVTFVPMAAVGEGCSGVLAQEERAYREVSRGYTYFEDADVLFSKITPCVQNGKHALASDLLNGIGFGTTEFHVVRAGPDIEPRHLFRVLTQPQNIENCVRSFSGTAGQQRVQPDVLKSLRLFLPPLQEQRAIAAILDSIDEAIERTEGVIAATERLRDALLHDLLTRGLPGRHTEWKEVQGLGTIPACWDVVRLGDVCEPPEYGAVASARPHDPDLPRYVRITDLTEDGRLRDEELRSADPNAVEGYELYPGDMLFARSGATVGKTYMYRTDDGPCVYAGYLIRFRPQVTHLCPEFLELWTHTQMYFAWVQSMLRAGAQPNINATEYASLRIPLPPLDEQERISRSIASITSMATNSLQATHVLCLAKATASHQLLEGGLRVSRGKLDR